MKTPEEIKKSLRVRASDKISCDCCLYNGNGCRSGIARDVLAYINQLENQFRDATKMVAHADSDTWKRRAEAAVRDMRPDCRICAYNETSECRKRYKTYLESSCDPKYNCWQWRGPCKKNGGTP